ncbi:GK isoform 11, partial [Pan troglodytes]
SARVAKFRCCLIPDSDSITCIPLKPAFSGMAPDVAYSTPPS